MVTLIHGDALQELRKLPSGSADMCFTSPPYWKLKDFGVDGQIGRERTLPEYLADLADVFNEVKRVVGPRGTLWLNMGDTYAGDSDGYPKKTLLQVPHRLAIMLQEQGWILRNELIWHKPNPIPGSITDRFTVDHEYVLFFAASGKYYFEQQREPARSSEKAGKRSRQNLHRWVPDGFRNRRTVWNDVKPGPYGTGHPAPFPEALAEIPIRAGSRPGGTILDPFVGSGTTCVVAERLGRDSVGIDLNVSYLDTARRRLARGTPHVLVP